MGFSAAGSHQLARQGRRARFAARFPRAVHVRRVPCNTDARPPSHPLTGCASNGSTYVASPPARDQSISTRTAVMLSLPPRWFARSMNRWTASLAADARRSARCPRPEGSRAARRCRAGSASPATSGTHRVSTCTYSRLPTARVMTFLCGERAASCGVMSPCLSCHAMSVWSSVSCSTRRRDAVDAAVAHLGGHRVVAEDEQRADGRAHPALVAVDLGDRVDEVRRRLHRALHQPARGARVGSVRAGRRARAGRRCRA